jgi:hypothetical protein
MTITAKFNGRCRNCGGRIAAGERIEWSRETGATHENAQDCERIEVTEEAVPETKTVALGTFTPIYKMFETAAQHLKHPKLKFQLDNGRMLKLYRAGARSKFPGLVNVTDGGAFGQNEWYGRIAADGTWTQAQTVPTEVVEAVKALAQGPAAYVGEKGRLAGACCFCGLRLTDARSTTVGYGSICAGHYGLPWGEAQTTLEQVGVQQVA